MAEWKETLEPYVKVTERVRTAALNPTAGEDLILGVALITDAGPSIPTLITSQSEFLSTYASGDITEDYIKSLDKLYTGSNTTLASTMWYNAYRLAGSNTLLACRASKADGIYFAQPLVSKDENVYILRDGELLKKVTNFKIVINTDEDEAVHTSDGWSININGVGIFGNRTTDLGAQYDYFVNSLSELVNNLNESSKFFSPEYSFYSDEKGEVPVASDSVDIRSVIFEEVYLGVDILDLSDVRCPEGYAYLTICEPDWETTNLDQKTIDLNSTAYSGFEAPSYFATNVYNSSSELKVRIRRFNHDAVVNKTISSSELTENSESPWTVLSTVLDTFTKNGVEAPDSSILERDFYEVSVIDPSVSSDVLIFNIGTVVGRGDMTIAEVNSSLSMINLSLPSNMNDLGLDYYGYEKQSGDKQIFVNLSIDPTKYTILNVSDTELLTAIDQVSQNEVYVVEGLCDLGNTEPIYQSYLANLAIMENYFYPASTVLSSNYLTIANSAARLVQDSYKLYLSAPWDVETGTFGWSVNMSPSVLYWEAVSRNKRNNSEFAPIFGQSTGVIQYQNPITEFNKRTRQLLLTKKINTVLWNSQTSAWNMNDNFTKQSVDNIMSDESNSRLAIRISKAQPFLLKQFIGWKISPRLWESGKSVIDYWFRSSILPMNYNIDAYRIIIDETNNPTEIQRQNKMQVDIYVRYQRSLKYVLVYHDIFDVGMDLE